MARLAVLLILLFPISALAHRVNVFAYAEGEVIHVEGRFQKGAPARDSEVHVLHASRDHEYLQGRTDSDGRFSFPIPAQARADRADLKLRLSAGEGHQNEWILAARQYLPPSPAAAQAPRPLQGGGREGDGGLGEPLKHPIPTPTLALKERAPACPPPPDLTPQVEAALERKIAPLRQMLLENQEPGPREIIGGIGYLVGIAGLLAYARARRMSGGKP